MAADVAGITVTVRAAGPNQFDSGLGALPSNAPFSLSFR
jgi:hypothetical protein